MIKFIDISILQCIMLLPTTSQKIVRLIVFSFLLMITMGGGILLGIIGIFAQQWGLLVFGIFMGLFSILPIVYLQNLLDDSYDMDEEFYYEQNTEG